MIDAVCYFFEENFTEDLTNVCRSFIIYVKAKFMAERFAIRRVFCPSI